MNDLEALWADVVASAQEHAAHLRAVDAEEAAAWGVIGEVIVPSLDAEVLRGCARFVGEHVVAPTAILARREAYVSELVRTEGILRAAMLSDAQLAEIQEARRLRAERLAEVRVAVKKRRAEPGFLERYDQVRLGKRTADEAVRGYDQLRAYHDELEREAALLAEHCARHFRARNRVAEVREQQAHASAEFLADVRRTALDALVGLPDDELLARGRGDDVVAGWFRRVVGVRAKRQIFAELLDAHLRETSRSANELRQVSETDEVFQRAMLPQRVALLAPRLRRSIAAYRAAAGHLGPFDDYARLPPDKAVLPALRAEVDRVAALGDPEVTRDDWSAPLPALVSEERRPIPRDEDPFQARPSGLFSRPRMSEPGTLRAGARVGRYVIRGLLGKGGMGEIYQASQLGAEGFEKDVVVKRMASAVRGDEQYAKMFVREARIAAALNHPNIVQIFDLQSDGDGLFIVMERLDGLSLQRLRRGDAPPTPVVMRMLADAARGLGAAHAQTDDKGQPVGLVHRDISPDNLFACTSGFTKILDFGIAKRNDFTVVTARDELKGKIPYMSPEQIRGDVLDGRADLFSLGASFYWVLTGQRPFGGASEVATLHAVLTQEPRDLLALRPDLPRPHAEVVHALLEKRREDRPRDAREVLRAVEALLPASHDNVAAWISSALETQPA